MAKPHSNEAFPRKSDGGEWQNFKDNTYYRDKPSTREKPEFNTKGIINYLQHSIRQLNCMMTTGNKKEQVAKWKQA